MGKITILFIPHYIKVPYISHIRNLNQFKMKSAKYIRTSTSLQNTSRQETTEHKMYVDKISGSVPFNERPNAIRLLNDVRAGKITSVYVESVDRLGRNGYDVATTINTLTSMNVEIVIVNLNLHSIIDRKPNPMFSLITSILGSIAEQERHSILERQKFGIEKAKRENRYTGRVKGTIEDTETFLSKYNKAHLELIQDKNYSIRKLATITNLSTKTIQKIRKIEIGI